MKILTSLAIMALAGSLSAQSTAGVSYLSENFDAGVIPPAGWTHVNNNANPAIVGWIADGTGRAWCEDEGGGAGTADITLVSPVMDLSTAGPVFLHFDGETNWANYLANHPSSLGDGISTMEVSTDGGLTWAVVWTDTSLNSGDTHSPSVDLSSYAGNASVQLGIHFYGSYAQEWWVDNVNVDNSAPTALTYAITALVAGTTATFDVSGATAGGTVILGYSLSGAGPTTTPFGVVDMSAPISTLVTLTADGAGNASFSPTVPGGAAGATLYTQGVDLGSGVLTNSLAMPVL